MYFTHQQNYDLTLGCKYAKITIAYNESYNENDGMPPESQMTYNAWKVLRNLKISGFHNKI